MGASWAAEEFRTLNLGDARLNRRATKLVEALTTQPGASIPKACGNEADTKAAYRLLSSEEVDPAEIRRAHAEATVERVREAQRVLAVQDTTSLDYTSRSSLRGAGMLESENGSGLMVHSAMALTVEGVPLGLLHQQVWARDPEEVGKRHTRRQRTTPEKESYRWVETIQACEQMLPLHVEAWVIGDRESDIFDVFALKRRPGLELVVRSAQNRRVRSDAGTKLREVVEAAPVAGKLEIEVPRSRKRKARTAVLEVQHCRMELLPPKNHLERKTLSPVPVSVVRVREQGTVPEGEEPIEWVLVTSVYIGSFEDAVEIVKAYAQRWKVERYHYVLKSGCRIEDLQLEHVSRIERALALYNVVAWRLLRLTYWSRAEPEQPCTTALEEDEWKALWVIGASKPLPKQPPKLREAVRMIAKLGGFQGRKNDGEPGVQSLWWGFRRLMDFTLAYRRLTYGFVGNG
jgi:Transposase DNA-binding/Transposase Tn5 dimerisation domain